MLAVILAAAVATQPALPRTDVPLLGQDFCGDARRPFEAGAARLGPVPRRQ
ncbi:MAG: hypothetical protein O9260_15655 [Silanimonas sp.]|jgi:hypothetical protein|nr:hypothetical protein [Silanimonas sp.]